MTTLTLNRAAVEAAHFDSNCVPEGKPMGLGALGTNDIIFKRKFRWTMEIEFCTGGPQFQVAKEFVKVGARPSLDIEETEINYLHGKMWIPGKATWQTIAVTYYDVSGKAPGGLNIAALFSWIASVYDITDSTCLFMGSTLNSYEGCGRLILWDGCGQPLEGWLLRNMWPQSINFGDLDMSSSEEVTVELTLRYSNVEYVTYCGGTVERCPCVPCPA